MNPHTRIVVVVSLVAAVALLSISVGHGAAVKPAKHTVTIEAVQFQPTVVEARRGDSIVWINKDPFPHTVTSTGKFDSKKSSPESRGPTRFSSPEICHTSARFIRR